jgi:hypothetical protein
MCKPIRTYLTRFTMLFTDSFLWHLYAYFRLVLNLQNTFLLCHLVEEIVNYLIVAPF